MPENQNIEWKSSWRDEFLKWICGFANAQGGKIFIGKDNNGKVTGIADYKKLMDDIPNKIQNCLGIICDVNLHKQSGKYFIEIDVPPYDVPISYHGKYHYRSGSTKQELKGPALNEFLLKKAGKTWDDVIEPNATLQDIDEKAIEAFKNGAIKSKRLPSVADDNITELLENLRLLKNNQLKRSAVLLFGKDPRDFFPTAYVKIGKFGKSDSDLLFQDVVEGNAFQLADFTIEILEKKYLISPISYEGLHRIEGSEYPYKAVREMLLNAIIHRTYTSTPIQMSVYDNKLMVWNEGTLPENLIIEDLKHKHSSYPKNPILADTCFKGGLIEAWGRGTLKIIDECKKSGLPEPKIEIMSGGICVTLFKDIYNETHLKNLGLNERQIKAVLYTKENKKITNKEYQEINSVSKATATRDLTELTELLKDIEKKGETGVGTYYKLKGS